MSAKKTAKKPKRAKYSYEVAPDVQAMLEDIVRHLPDEFPHVDTRRVVCYRSRGSTARIYARIWSLPGIWQAALGVEAHYVIEVVERFDRESREEQEKTILHELMHIPKTFSGNLVPHKCFGKTIDCDSENRLYKRLQLARAVEARARETAARAMSLARSTSTTPPTAPTTPASPPTRSAADVSAEAATAVKVAEAAKPRAPSERGPDPRPAVVQKTLDFL